VVPARLFTIFSTRTALVEEARSRADAIRGRLDRFRDVREWDLKVSYDTPALAKHLAEFSNEIAELDRGIAEAKPGRRYLLERKREEAAARATAGVAAEEARRYLARLAPMADEVTQLELPAQRRDLPVVLSAALLVRTDRAAALQSAASEIGRGLGARGIHLSLTGPWAPYRFVGEDARA
jgi:hypothetical protein